MIRYTSVATFLFFAIALIIPSGFSVGAAMLFIGGSYLMIVRICYRTTSHLHSNDRFFIGILFTYFAINCILNLVHMAPGREYDTFSRFLLAIPALVLLLQFPPRPAVIWSGIAFGAFSSGLYAIVQVSVFDYTRATGSTNPIQYGNICMLLSILCLCGLVWAWQQPQRRVWLLICTLCAALGITGSLLTGSRGSWLGLPVSVIIVFIYLMRHISGITLRGLVLTACLAPGIVFLLPGTPLQYRLHLIGEEVHQYLDKRNTSTSIGTRMEMWRSATLLIPEHPFIGWGKQRYQQRTAELVSDGQVGTTLIQHSHLHNDYIDATVKHGIAGLVTVLLLYLGTLLLFYRLLKATQTTNAFALAGILLIVNYALFGLTQAFLTHNNGVMLFAFGSIVLWACARQDTPRKTH